MSATNDRRKQQLGMPAGTANARLRRLLFWDLLVETGRTMCFRCGEIMDESNWSIDHKVPYLHEDSTRFWDRSNIGYSHKVCNTAAARRRSRSAEAPDGMSWCATHQAYLPVGDFNRDRAKKSGYGNYCRVCVKVYRPTFNANRMARRKIAK